LDYNVLMPACVLLGLFAHASSLSGDHLGADRSVGDLADLNDRLLERLAFFRDQRRVGGDAVKDAERSGFADFSDIGCVAKKFHRSSPSTTGFASVPMPGMDTETMSPATSGPTPAGVPVMIKSPGRRVMTCEMKRIITSMGKMNEVVLADCLTSSLTRVSTW